MFGLEDQKKKKPGEEFVFDLERELKIPKKAKDLRTLVDNRIQKVKDVLRAGQNQEEFDLFGILLHGYNALIKVMARAQKTK